MFPITAYIVLTYLVTWTFEMWIADLTQTGDLGHAKGYLKHETWDCRLEQPKCMI